MRALYPAETGSTKKSMSSFRRGPSLFPRVISIVATETGAAGSLLTRLAEVVAARAGRPERERDTRNWPRLLAVLDARLGLDPAALAQLLDDAAAGGLSVVWLAETSAEIPRQADEVVAALRAFGRS